MKNLKEFLTEAYISDPNDKNVVFPCVGVWGGSDPVIILTKIDTEDYNNELKRVKYLCKLLNLKHAMPNKDELGWYVQDILKSSLEDNRYLAVILVSGKNVVRVNVFGDGGVEMRK